MTEEVRLPHLLLIGATGRVGGLVLKDASQRGYRMTVVVRNPHKVQEDSIFADTSVETIKGDPCEEEDMVSVFRQILSEREGPLIIISTLGQTRKSGNPWAAPTSPAGFMSKAADALLAACRSLDENDRARIEKYVVLSMFGVDDSFDQLNCLLKPVMHHSNMLQTLQDHDALNKIVQEQDLLKWVLVRAAMLSAGEAQPVKVYPSNGNNINFWPSISMGSVAAFLVDACTDKKLNNTAVVVAN